MRSTIVLLLLAAANLGAAGLRDALTFHASFDASADADFAAGDRRLYTAPGYKEQAQAKPGIGNPDVSLAPGSGRYGGALRFARKNSMAIFYQGHRNVAYRPENWSGTVSFWLSLDPETDLEPGFCDPVQITDKAYNDAAIWVDFTKDDKPRHFRLGVFGDLKIWNPQAIPPDKNPDFNKRLVVVRKPPFSRGQWTHVAITFSGLGGQQAGGVAKLYLNGQLQGASEPIREPFTWDTARSAIRLGLSYVGLFDDLAVFNRALSDQEVRELYRLKDGARSLHK